MDGKVGMNAIGSATSPPSHRPHPLSLCSPQKLHTARSPHCPRHRARPGVTKVVTIEAEMISAEKRNRKEVGNFSQKFLEALMTAKAAGQELGSSLPDAVAGEAGRELGETNKDAN